MPIYIALIFYFLLCFQSYLGSSKSRELKSSQSEHTNLATNKECAGKPLLPPSDQKQQIAQQEPHYRSFSVTYREKISVWNQKKRKFVLIYQKESKSVLFTPTFAKKAESLKK